MSISCMWLKWFGIADYCYNPENQLFLSIVPVGITNIGSTRHELGHGY